MTIRCLLPMSLLPVLLCGGLSARLWADMPTWRGADRTAHVQIDAPDTWPQQLRQVWRVEVGEGHASPVVAGEQVFQFSRLGDLETLMYLDTAGRQMWRQQYAAPYKLNNAARRHGKGPKATPAVHQGRLFTLGISGIFSGWSADTGQQLWQHDYTGRFAATSPLYGTAMSPLTLGGDCVAHVGGNDGGSLIRVSGQTGETVWSWDEDGPSYASPVPARLGGVDQIVTQSQTRCIGVSLDGRLLWSIPYETQYVQNIVTPVVQGDRAFFSGFNRGVQAYRIASEDGSFEPQLLWENKEVSMYMSSPVLHNGMLYGFSQQKSGQLFCLRASDGQLMWQGPPRQGRNGLLLVASAADGSASWLLTLTTDGELVVSQPQPEEYAEVARYKLSETECWAQPAVWGRQLLVKDAEHLAMWTWKTK